MTIELESKPFLELETRSDGQLRQTTQRCYTALSGGCKKAPCLSAAVTGVQSIRGGGSLKRAIADVGMVRRDGFRDGLVQRLYILSITPIDSHSLPLAPARVEQLREA